MNFEAGKFSEKEKKLKKDQEKKEIQEFLDKQKTHEVTKKQIETQIQAEEQLSDLKELVEKGVITHEQAEHIANNQELDNKDIQEIFENIDKVEDIQDIDNYLPADLRITKNEYHQAMVDEVYRTQTLVKIKTALTVLSQQSGVSNQSGVNLFTGFLSLLDKNLVLIQEHNIDMKNNLEKIDNNKNNTHTSIWKSIKDFFKEVLQ